MADCFEGIIAQLKEEGTRLGNRKTELTAQLQTVEADIQRVEAALAALGDKPSAKAAPRKRGGRQLGATREQVASLVKEVLQDMGTLQLDTLRSEVEARLRDKGLSRVGFAARFKEALGDDRFNESPAGWKLIAGEEAGQPHHAVAEVHAS